MYLLWVILVSHSITINSYEYSYIGKDVPVLCADPLTAPDTCYCTEVAEDLPYIDDVTVSVPDNAIFFIDTTCNEALDLRQLCSVEAAARANPDREINVLFAGPVRTHSTSPTWEILKFSNVNLYRVRLATLVKHTPLSQLMGNEDRCPLHRLSDIIRFLVLYKYGGIYLSFNVIAVQPFDVLPQYEDWIAKVDAEQISTEIFSLSKEGIGQAMAELALRRLLLNFRNKEWADRSNDTLNEVLMRICGTAVTAQMTSDICNGFEFYDSSYFFPISYEDREVYFDVHPEGRVIEDPVAFYVWDYLTFNEPVSEYSLYKRLIHKHCPVIQEYIAERSRKPFSLANASVEIIIDI